MITAYISLGSNMGDSLRLLQESWHALGRQPEISLDSISKPYRTEPVDMPGSNWFINAAGSLRTDLGPERLLERLLAVEKQFGRVRDSEGERFQDRSIDLDLLLYDQLVMHGGRLVLPHPELARRAFVLIPLSEIAPDFRHPVLNHTISELLKLLPTGPAPVVERISWPQSAA